MMQTAKWILKRINFPGDVVLSGQEEYSIGRGRDNYETVLSLFVSRKHCIFRVTDNGITVEDLSSSNGTFVNEERIPAKTYYTLRDSDNIGIGVGTVKESDHFVYRLVKEELKDDHDLVCLDIKNEVTEKYNKSSNREILPCVQSSEKDEDDLLIIERDIDIIDLSDGEEEYVNAVYNKSAETSLPLNTPCISRSIPVDSCAFSNVQEGKKAILIKEEQCNNVKDSNATSVSGVKLTIEQTSACDITTPSASVISSVHSLTKKSNSDVELKIEPGQQTHTEFEESNSENRCTHFTSDICQSAVKLEQTCSNVVVSGNIAAKKSCSSIEEISLNNASKHTSNSIITTEIEIKKENEIDDISIAPIKNTCAKHSNNRIFDTKQNQISFSTDIGRTKYVNNLETSSNSTTDETVKDSCPGVIKSVDECIKQRSNVGVQKENIQFSSVPGKENEKKIASKRSYETVNSLSCVNVNRTPGPASKKPKFMSGISGDCSKSSSSSSSSRSQHDTEDDKVDKWFATFSLPFLDEIEKTEVTKSISSSPAGNNVKGIEAESPEVHAHDTKMRKTRGNILSRREDCGERNALPLHLDPVVKVEKLDTAKLRRKVNTESEKSSLHNTLIGETMQILTSTPKQRDAHVNDQNSYSGCSSRFTSISNYSRSDDVIVIDDNDESSVEEGPDKSSLQKYGIEDCKEDVEEICVKQEIFDDDDGQVIDDGDDDADSVNDWVFKLSQSSSPLKDGNHIECSSPVEVKRRRIFNISSDSSDEDLLPQAVKTTPCEGDHVKRNLGDEYHKQCYNSSKERGSKGDKRSRISKDIVNNIEDQSKERNKEAGRTREASLAPEPGNENYNGKESDESEISLYAEKLLEDAVLAQKEKKQKSSSKTVKALNEKKKSGTSQFSSRRTLMCPALPMKSKSHSKSITEGTDKKKTLDADSEMAKHSSRDIFKVKSGKTCPSEDRLKESVEIRTDDSTERERRIKVRENRKAKLKALTEQKANATSKTQTKVTTKSSYLAKNTSSSRGDKLAESLAKSHSSNSNKKKIKVRVVRKDTTENGSHSSNELSGHSSSNFVNKTISDENTPTHSTSKCAISSETSSEKSHQNRSVSELELQIKELSVKDRSTYKIPKLKQPDTSTSPNEIATTATSSVESSVVRETPSTTQGILLRSALRNTSTSYVTKRVHFAPSISLCTVQSFPIESGNSLHRIEGKDAPLRKLQASQAEALYDASQRVLNRVIVAILKHWNPRWLSEERIIIQNGGEPPPAHCQKIPVLTLCPMLTAFSSYKEYLKIVDPLMMLDLWARVSEDANKPNPRTREKYDIAVNDVKDANGIITLSCSMSVSTRGDKEGLYPHVGDLCIIRYPIWGSFNPEAGHTVVESQQEKYFERFAYVETLTRDFRSTNNSNRNQGNSSGNSRNVSFPLHCTLHLIVKLKGDSSLKLTNPSLRVISSIRSELRMFEAVGYLKHTKLCNMILNPCVSEYKLPRVDSNMHLASQGTLNAAQKTAVLQCASICSHSSPKLGLIQGPPGTGKTKVIVNIIKQILYPGGQYSKLRFDKKHRILLCAPSNAAADEMAERLLSIRSEMPKENRFKMVRTGTMDYIRENVRGVSLDELAKKEVEASLQNRIPLESVDIEIATLEARRRSYIMAREHAASKNESIAMYEKRIQETEKRIGDLKSPMKSVLGHKSSEVEREARKKVLSHADIVVTTLGSAFNSQMTEVFASRNGRSSARFTSCIIDEATQCKEPECLIPFMYGIEKIVMVGDPEQLPATVLSKVAKAKSFGQSFFNRVWNKFQNEANNPIVFLNTQYRMHPDIYHWPNTYIYHGRVLSDFSVNFRYPLRPYCLFAHQFPQHSHSFVNSNEAILVSDVAVAVAHKFSAYVKTIGIITPYQKQLQEIKTRLEGSRFNNVSIVVNTIDGFQGRECDVIIFSCVRTRGVGFMGESQRLNVALTRARTSLIICGNFVSLQEDQMWSSLLGDAMQRGVVVNAGIRNMDGDEIVNYLLQGL